MSVSDFSELTRSKPERSLLSGRLNKSGGRNADGHVTSWHRGGGHKRRYRVIDFRRDKTGIPARVAAIEYDPNRSANIALLNYADGEKRYIIAPAGLAVGDRVQSGDDAEIRTGNALGAREDPARHGPARDREQARQGRAARARGRDGRAADGARGRYATLRMPSGEHRRVHVRCMATIGQVGNTDHENTTIGKAGARAGRASARTCAASR
jgi:large subunit ribosomal protein L2